MEFSEVEKRINNLITKVTGGANPDDIDELNQWKSSVARAFLTDNISKHEGVRLILERFQDDLDEINEVLLSADSEKLNDVQRDRLLDKKKLYTDFIGIFELAKQEIVKTDMQIKEEEENLKNF